MLKFLQSLKLVAVTTLPSGHLEYKIAGSATHHHLICAECGADREISDGVYASFVEAIEKDHGFQVETTHLTLHGLCADCLERRDPNEPTS